MESPCSREELRRPLESCEFPRKLLLGKRRHGEIHQDHTLSLNVTDRMLAAGVSPQLDKAFGVAGGQFQNLKLNLDALTFVEKTGKAGHTYALLAVDIDVTDLLSSMGGNMLGALAVNIMPQKILLSMTIDVGDVNVKAKQATRFLEAGNKVKVSIRLRGRQMAHASLAKKVMTDFADLLKELAVIEKPVNQEGRNLIMILAPAKK